LAKFLYRYAQGDDYRKDDQVNRASKGQITVYSMEQIIYWFETANYEDCRINAYPVFISEAEEQDYRQGINLNLFAPNILLLIWMKNDSSLKKN
jgi:hypothetical protein